MIDKLTKIIDEEDTLYNLQEVKDKSTRFIELENGDYLSIINDENLVEYALLHFVYSENSHDLKDTMVEVVFHGYGFSGALREMRHTYWGVEGYTFYLPGKGVIKALTILQEYFDMD